jgi:hypothetical protein
MAFGVCSYEHNYQDNDTRIHKIYVLPQTQGQELESAYRSYRTGNRKPFCGTFVKQTARPAFTRKGILKSLKGWMLKWTAFFDGGLRDGKKLVVHDHVNTSNVL